MLFFRSKIKTIWNVVIRAILASAIIMIAVYIAVPTVINVQLNKQYVTVDFLDVGQGDSIYIEFPDGTNMLIDGGPDNSVLRELGSVMPVWKNKIDYVFVTHPDFDHYAGLFGVIERYTVGHLFTNGQGGRDEYFPYFKQYADEHDVSLSVLSRGAIISGPDDISLRVLAPHESTHGDLNAFSLVLYLEWRNLQVLLTGDLGKEGERQLLDHDPSLSVDILKAGHHGSDSSSDETFLQRIHAHYCIISSGVDNRYGHPHPDVLQRLQHIGCTIFRTDMEGTVSFMSDGYILYYQGETLPI